MFLTVFGQKGGVAKTCTSIHLACVWAQQGLSVCVVDADRNRSATAYAARGMLPFEVVPVEAAAKATRHAQVIITDGQASSHEEILFCCPLRRRRDRLSSLLNSPQSSGR